MINPEFKRNLWLQFSLHRAFVTPVLLGLTFLVVNVEELPKLGAVLFMGIVWFWGARTVTASVMDEFRDKTWDQQRMSALQPWTMTWGKLFGATSFNWYAGLLCLAAVFVAELMFNSVATAAIHALTLIAIGVLVHASALAVNLHMAGKAGTSLIQRGGIGWVIVLLVLPSMPWLLALNQESILWWGTAYQQNRFLLGSSVFFALSAVFAAWRVMSNALQVRTLPWAWPLFACIVSFFIAGFGEKASMPYLVFVALAVSAAMTYAALFSEPNHSAVWQRVIVRFQAHDWHGLFEHLPVFVTTLLLLFFYSIATLWMKNTSAFSDKLDIAAGHLSFISFTLAFMVLRDACIFLFFMFSNNPKRAEATTLFYLIIINGLLPFLAKVAHLSAVYYSLLPLDPLQIWSPVIMAFHAVIAASLLVWRWRVTLKKREV